MATASTPTRSRRPSRDASAPTSHPPSRSASLQLDHTVRFPPDALRLYASIEARDLSSMTAAARQITAARTRPAASPPQSSLFAGLRESQAGSPDERANRTAPRFRRPSPSPARTHSSR